jgi:hypothetical protein
MKLVDRFTSIAGLIFILASFWSGGCALFERTAPVVPEMIPDLVWPNPPEPPRIKYLRTIAAPVDLGISKSIWRKIWEFIVGSEEEKIVKPYGIQTDGKGRIYIAVSVARVVHVFDTEDSSFRLISLSTPKARSLSRMRCWAGY